MPRVLVVNGSPRNNSNSTALSEYLVNELMALVPSAHVVTKDLKNLHITCCTGCDRCKMPNGVCIYRDDMTHIYPLVRDSDLIILSSPVYWWGISAQLKAFIDRLYALDTKDFKEKRLFVITTGSDEETGVQYRLIHEQFSEICTYLEMQYIGFMGISADDEHRIETHETAFPMAKEHAKAIVATYKM